MRAYVINEHGGPEVFTEQDVSTPEIHSNEVPIRVNATSVNPVDCLIRAGKLRVGPKMPGAILHADVAGVIEKIGSAVGKFEVGDEVYGCAGGLTGHPEALAEFMAADEDLLAHKPDSLTMESAAALPLVCLTAWEGLVDKAKMRADDKVLIYGGAGGVGHVAVQIAKARGATVYATVSNKQDAAYVKGLGIDGVINYKKSSVADYVQEHTGGSGFDIVFDPVGGDNFPVAVQATKLNGHLISTLLFGEFNLSAVNAKGLNIHAVMMQIPIQYGIGREHHGTILNEISKLVDSNDLHPLIDENSFSLKDIAKAHAHYESGQARGKSVVTNYDA